MYDSDINHCVESLHNYEIEINNKNKNIMIDNDLEVIRSKISINEKN